MSRDLPTTTVRSGDSSSVPSKDSGGEYFFSSGAITFAAMMDVIAAYRKMANEQAELAQHTALLQGQIAISMAQAAHDVTAKDADVLRLQGYEAFGQGASGLTSLVGSTLAIGLSRGLSDKGTSIANMSGEMNKTPLTSAGALRTGDAPIGPAAPPQDGYDRIRTQIKEGSFFEGRDAKSFVKDFKKGLNTRLDAEGNVLPSGSTEGLTLREIMQRGDPADFPEMRKAFVKARQTALKESTAQQSHIQNWTQLFGQFGTAGSSIYSGGAKQQEAQVTSDKAAASQIQTADNAANEFLRGISQSQLDQFGQSSQGVKSTWDTIGAIVRTDTQV